MGLSTSCCSVWRGDTAWAVGSVSQAHAGQPEQEQLPFPIYRQLARDEMCEGVFDHPMPLCLLAQRSSEIGLMPIAYSLSKSQPVPNPKWTGRVGEQLFCGQPCSSSSRPLSAGETLGVGNYMQPWGLKAWFYPSPGLRTSSCRTWRVGRAPAPRFSALAGPLPGSPGLGALPIVTRLCPVFVHLFCSPHFASPERGSCSSVNTIFESSHAVWAQILALIYCCVHFTALKSREFKSPLNTIGDTRRPVFWSSPINGYKFESRQQGSRAGKD